MPGASNETGSRWGSPLVCLFMPLHGLTWAWRDGGVRQSRAPEYPGLRGGWRYKVVRDDYQVLNFHWLRTTD